MKIYIDQSGKVEYTSQPTIVAYSNGKDKSICIAGKEKQKIQKVFREAGKPDMFTFKTFATLIYLLIKTDLTKLQTIIIDREYEGREDLIKKYLIELIRRSGHEFDAKSISFAEIGKKSNTHRKAIDTFRKDQKADIKVSSKDLLEWIL